MAGGGGGAWKVAYADFVTAMMAFFLVMWIVAQSDQMKHAIAHHFQDPFARESEEEGTVLLRPKREREAQQPSDVMPSSPMRIATSRLDPGHTRGCITMSPGSPRPQPSRFPSAS